MSDWWKYENLPSGEPYDWAGAARGDSPYDNIDFHLDLGMGKLKKGRLGIDRFFALGVDLVIDLNTLLPAPLPPQQGSRHNQTIDQYRAYRHGDSNWRDPGLPFPDDSIESIISHHCLEHLTDGFIPLMDECHRILKPGGILRIIVPLFPSRTAVEDPDHRRWFMEGTFDAFCGTAEGESWLESFSVPYTTCRFEMVDKDLTPRPEDPADYWGEKDAREIRVALKKHLTQGSGS